MISFRFRGKWEVSLYTFIHEPSSYTSSPFPHFLLDSWLFLQQSFLLHSLKTTAPSLVTYAWLAFSNAFTGPQNLRL